jgi:PAS domain S-box-containing protein
LHDLQGQVIGLVGIARDVTEQKLAQEQLDRLMHQQQIILDNIPVGVAFEKKNVLEWTNDTLASLIGYSSEQMKSLPMRVYYPDLETYERLVKLSRERLAQGKTFTVEGPLKRKDGSLIWCDVVAQAINPHNLDDDGILWVVQDITEKRRADEQLRQLSRAVEASPASIVITDTTGKIQYVNPKFTQVTGYNSTEAIGQNPRILKTDQTPPEVHRHLWETLTSGQEWRGEFCNQKKNGERYWELASISPIIDPAGNITHYVAVKEDITKRKQMEEDLAFARDQALEASRYKSELLAKVSHELRTPLGVILGYTEFLHKEMFGALTAKQKYVTAEVLDSTSYLNNLINDLLDQSQIERGIIRIQIAPFDLREMVDQLSASLKPMAEAKGLNFKTDVASELPATLSGDQKRLRQILTNLVNNAIKFTETGSVTVRIQPSGSTHWAMQVIDTGPGIPLEAQTRIFDSFWQMESSLTGKQKGYGLGLSIVKQLTRLMGGQMTLDSTVGQGSAFTVVFPLEPALVEETLFHPDSLKK